MTITLKPKEIAELVELLARRTSTEEVIQVINDEIDELVDKVSARQAAVFSELVKPSDTL